MINEENNNKKNAFLVPDGYFDQLTERVMNGLPAQETKHIHFIPRLWRYAAVATFALVGTATIMHYAKNDQQQIAQEEIFEDDYINEALDFSMMNNLQIAECLVDKD